MNSTYRFPADTPEIDRGQVHPWLSAERYWDKGRTRDMQDRAIDGSRNAGVYDTDSGRQFAYAWEVTHGGRPQPLRKVRV
ncbi:MAG: hypothetical protein ABI563_02420 [Specibacter sp.]